MKLGDMSKKKRRAKVEALVAKICAPLRDALDRCQERARELEKQDAHS